MATLAIRNALLEAVLLPTVVQAAVAPGLRLIGALAVLEQHTQELARLRHAGHTIFRHIFKELQDLSSSGVHLTVIPFPLARAAFVTFPFASSTATFALTGIKRAAFSLAAFIALTSAGDLRQIGQAYLHTGVSLQTIHKGVQGRFDAADNLDSTPALLSKNLPQLTVGIEGLRYAGELMARGRVTGDGIEQGSVPGFLDRKGHQSDLVERQSTTGEGLT